MEKPITPLAHGIIDYGIIASLFVVPKTMDMDKKAQNLYSILGSSLGIYNAVTNHGAGILPLVSFKTHYKIDYFNLGLVGLLGFHRAIRKDKKALLFHAALVALATATVVLTDVSRKSKI